MLSRPRLSSLALLAGIATVVSACGTASPGAGPSSSGPRPTQRRQVVPPITVAPTTVTSPQQPAEPGNTVATLLAAGDIASCRSTGDEATAALLDGREGVVATLGDNVYESGTLEQFRNCYDPTWGRHRARTRPSPGNHDYASGGGTGYHTYFGAAAGERGRGWYSYEVGSWHVIALNSNCGAAGCARGSAQERWLRADLARNRNACTLAYWHHPRFSSGLHGSTRAMADLYTALYHAGADVVLAGHDHFYERLAPLDPDGNVDRSRGIRSFVVGTGGRSHYPTRRLVKGSEVRNSDTFGVLSLTLGDGSYSWQFLPVKGRTFTDKGSGRCH